MQLLDLLARFGDVSEQPDGGYLALCPAHSDSRPSLRIWRGDDGKVRLTCRAGCQTEAVVRAAGLTWPDLFNVAGEGLTVSSVRPTLVGPGPTAALTQYIDACALALVVDNGQLAAAARAYLVRRFGLSIDMAADLSIGVDLADERQDEGMPYRSRSYRAHPRVTVPLVGFGGVPHGLQGRDITGRCPLRWVSLTNPDGARWGSYGLLRGQGGYGVTIVTEGPGDGLTVAAVGYDALVVRGASLVNSPELIAKIAAGLVGQTVLVAGDNDAAGKGFSARLVEGLSGHGLDVGTLAVPHEGEDVTAWRESDPDAFPGALHAAIRGARCTARTTSTPDTVSHDEGQDVARILADLVDTLGESDAMNAHALVMWSQGRIRYAPGLGYHVWDGRVWVRSDTRVRQEIHRMGAALVLAGRLKEARGFTMTTRIDALMTELRSVPGVYVDTAEFDNRPDLLNFRNGTVNLASGTLRPHSQEDLLTHCLDIDFRPDAPCDRWMSFLREIFPTAPDMPAYMQRLIGYGITGHTSEQMFAVFYGKGANGKSVVTDVLTHVFRPITRTTAFATFEARQGGGIPNDIAALRSARLVMATEGEAGRPMNESVLKRVTGKDMVSARFLHREFFEFRPTFLLLLATNHKPRFRGADEGLWRRIRLVPFLRYFEPHERDGKLSETLNREAEGIAAWAVRGAVEWAREGLKEPTVITRESREYRATSDPLAGFLPGVLEQCSDEHTMAGADAFNAYLEWCQQENLPNTEVGTRQAFYVRLEERGIERRRRRAGIHFIGLRHGSDTRKEGGPGIFGT